jgi:heme/copper-type cytochrome/quinol oxidase subunit 3
MLTGRPCVINTAQSCMQSTRRGVTSESNMVKHGQTNHQKCVQETACTAMLLVSSGQTMRMCNLPVSALLQSPREAQYFSGCSSASCTAAMHQQEARQNLRWTCATLLLGTRRRAA